LRLRALLLVIAAVFAVGFVAGCGDDDNSVSDATEAATEAADAADDAAGGAADAVSSTTVEIPVADEGLIYAVTEIQAPAGEITLTSVNDQAVPHNIAIETPDGDVEGEVVTDGGVSEITVTLEPGTYEYYCSVPGHREAGMVGTLTVE
jgi:plastocyanin